MADGPWIAKVQNDRLVLDAPTVLPDGTEVPLVPQEKEETSPLRCDVLLFVTTPSERETLRKVAQEKGLQVQERAGRASTYLDLGQVGSLYRVYGVETEIGGLRAGGSATKGLLTPIETGARYIIAVGMAFGIDRNTQKFGDVLIASHIFPYDAVTVDTDRDGRLPRTIYENSTLTETSPALRRLVQQESEKNSLGYSVHTGVILSGSAKIRCAAYRDHLVRKFNKRLDDLDKECQKRRGIRLQERVVGGEMEGIGLLATPTDGIVSCLIVKGISDFADEEHRDDSPAQRDAACENAMRLVLESLANAPASGDQPQDEANQ